MDIRAVVELLGRERGVPLAADYYRHIDMWRDWWRGCFKPFHQFKEQDLAGGVRRRQLYSLRMAKKVCEDWAAILLNERTVLSLGHRPSSLFLQGENGGGGLLAECGFWQRANALVEEAFYSGTGAMVLRARGVRTREDGTVLPAEGARLGLEYLPAGHIVPLTVRGGEIVEAAFCSEVLEGGRPYVYVETHTLEGEGYVVENRCLRAGPGGLAPAPLPAGLARRLRTRSPLPLFAILRPNQVNAIEGANGLGAAVFAQAIDNLKGVDLAYNNLCRDFQLGGKKVFFNRSMLIEDGGGGLLAPDDICQQLFLAVGERMPEEAQLIYEHNPALRVRDNVEGIQAQLDYLSFKCGLGAKHYRFESGGRVVTATQYVGDRQQLIQSASKHSLVVRRAVCAAARMLLWAGKALLGADTDPQTAIAVSFDDSVILDKETERERDRAEVGAGLMRRFEYRMKWYGEDEAAARAACAQAGSEQK